VTQKLMGLQLVKRRSTEWNSTQGKVHGLVRSLYYDACMAIFFSGAVRCRNTNIVRWFHVINDCTSTFISKFSQALTMIRWLYDPRTMIIRDCEITMIIQARELFPVYYNLQSPSRVCNCNVLFHPCHSTKVFQVGGGERQHGKIL